MKVFFYILGTIVVLALILMAFVKNSVSEIESHQYEVLKRFDGFEIRKYEEALFSSVILNSSSYNEISIKIFKLERQIIEIHCGFLLLLEKEAQKNEKSDVDGNTGI